MTIQFIQNTFSFVKLLFLQALNNAPNRFFYRMRKMKFNMETNNQMDQNPEKNKSIQEEKTEIVVEATQKNEAGEPQINESDKSRIFELIRDEAPATGDVQDAINKISQKSETNEVQINESDKSRIFELIRDEARATGDVQDAINKTAQKSEANEGQINESDKSQIFNLIKDEAPAIGDVQDAINKTAQKSETNEVQINESDKSQIFELIRGKAVATGDVQDAINKTAQKSEANEVQINESDKSQIFELIRGKAVATGDVREAINKTAQKSEANEVQINESDKAQIFELIREKAAAAGDVREAINKTAQKSETNEVQINESDKAQIFELIRDKAAAGNDNEAGEKTFRGIKKDETTKDSKKLQAVDNYSEISTTEKTYILVLLRDTHTNKYFKSSFLQEAINYEQLNKQELIELLEEVVQERDILKIKDQIAKIKVAFYKKNKEEIQKAKEAFIAEGSIEKDFKHVEDPLEKRFQAAFNHYKYNKAKYNEELEREKLVNLKEKLDILDELKELINSEETLKKTYDEFRNLQEKWKEIGLVPANELNNLWQNYHFLVEKFFDKVRINKELRDLDMKKNLEAKIVLCEKTEELLLEESIIKSFKLLQKYHDGWREIGPVPSDKKDIIWERFKAATNKINERRRQHYKELQQEQERNFEAKQALCEKAEEIVNENYSTIREWQITTDKINELLKMWKTVGHAPKVQNDEIWARFKTSLDQFFSFKKEFLAKIKEQQINNYNLKIDQCVRAEAMQDSDEWGKTTRELINLQKEWKKTGPVPRKYSDKIWARFRAACDRFFNRKEEHFRTIRSSEDENLKLKQELITEVKNFEIKENKKESLESLKTFQKRWMEIGHVPFASKDKVHKQYKEAFEKLMDSLNINNIEISAQNFKSKINMLKNSPNGDRKLSHERYLLSQKVKKLEDDIKLWENNIGFFSHSKQSEALKRDFEKKIDKAKHDLQLMNEEIKLINKEL